jgi:drug/metabolite transporter (DMT)-like permease
VVIPTVVTGTVILSMLAGIAFLGEAAGWRQLLGALLVVSGILVLFSGGRAAAGP